MRKIILISRLEEAQNRTGLGIYSENVESVLKNSGTEYEHLYISMPEDYGGGISGLLKWIISGVIFPAMSLWKRRKEQNTYHLMYEAWGFVLPFIKGKKIVTFHHVVKNEEKMDNSWGVFWRLNSFLSTHLADIIIAISPQTRDDLAEYFNTPLNKIKTVFNKPYSVFTTLDNMERERKIGCVSTLHKRKNVAALIKAFSLLEKMNGMSDVRLQICGKGPEKKVLEELALSLGIYDKIEFISDLSNDDLINFYNSIAVLANPSLHEGFGNVTFEAQRCSTPVVFFKNANIPPEVTKCAIPCEDEADLAEKMYTLITNDEYRDGIIRSGKEYADSFGREYDEIMLRLYLGSDAHGK